MSEVTVNWSALVGWLLVAQWIFNIAVGVWVYFRNADTSNTKAITKVAKDLADFVHTSGKANEGQNTRITKLETHIKHLPTDEEITALREGVAETKARVEGMVDAMRRIERQTNLIHDHLLRTRA